MTRSLSPQSVNPAELHLSFQLFFYGISKEGKRRGNNNNFLPHRRDEPTLVYYFQAPEGIVHAGSLVLHTMT